MSKHYRAFIYRALIYRAWHTRRTAYLALTCCLTPACFDGLIEDPGVQAVEGPGPIPGAGTPPVQPGPATSQTAPTAAAPPVAPPPGPSSSSPDTHAPSPGNPAVPPGTPASPPATTPPPGSVVPIPPPGNSVDAGASPSQTHDSQAWFVDAGNERHVPTSEPAQADAGEDGGEP